MSYVTNVMLTHDFLEPPGVRKMLWSTVVAEKQTLRENTAVDADGWGGSKFPEIDLWCGAFNYLDLYDFLAWVKSLPWRYPRAVQVFVQDQEEDMVSVWEIDGGWVLDRREML